MKNLVFRKFKNYKIFINIYNTLTFYLIIIYIYFKNTYIFFNIALEILGNC